MLNDTTAFNKIYIATGYTDLRQGIDGLASYVKMQFQLDPFDKDTLFLFCGRKATKIKGLVPGNQLQCLRLQKVNAGIDQTADDPAPIRLFNEPADTSLPIRHHHPVIPPPCCLWKASAAVRSTSVSPSPESTSVVSRGCGAASSTLPAVPTGLSSTT